jgi:hypothetical protein
MTTTSNPGEAVPNEERCTCHCHAAVYCNECNQPTGPLDDDIDARVQAAKPRIWARLLARHPEWIDQ